jgi:hypothetical protein
MDALKIKNLLIAGDAGGFTTPVRGALLRYVVAFTHCEGNSDTIAKKLYSVYETLPASVGVTIGGWTDTKTGKTYIDL